MFFKWLKKCQEPGYDYSIFNVSRESPELIISDYSKVPPSIFESAGVCKDSSANWNNVFVLRE